MQDIWKSYGAIKVLEGVGLEVEDGHSMCIYGQSGCGKSTLLKLVALITSPERGVFVIDGTDTTKLTPSQLEEFRKEKIAYSFQEPLLIPYISAVENITDIVGAPRDRAVEMLSSLGLSQRLNHRPGKLSVGEKKRVDVARAMLKGSKIIVADEPLSNLDPSTAETVMALLKEHTSKGGILIYSSVEPTESKFADAAFNMQKRG